jgi:hypothetical protein
LADRVKRVSVFALQPKPEKPMKEEMKMTALAHIQSFVPMADETSIMNGAGTEMFTTGLALNTTDMMAGDGVDMFTTSCITSESSAGGGDKVEMFTTSC